MQKMVNKRSNLPNKLCPQKYLRYKLFLREVARNWIKDDISNIDVAATSQEPGRSAKPHRKYDPPMRLSPDKNHSVTKNYRIRK